MPLMETGDYMHMFMPHSPNSTLSFLFTNPIKQCIVHCMRQLLPSTNTEHLVAQTVEFGVSSTLPEYNGLQLTHILVTILDTRAPSAEFLRNVAPLPALASAADSAASLGEPNITVYLQVGRDPSSDVLPACLA